MNTKDIKRIIDRIEIYKNNNLIFKYQIEKYSMRFVKMLMDSVVSIFDGDIYMIEETTYNDIQDKIALYSLTVV